MMNSRQKNQTLHVKLTNGQIKDCAPTTTLYIGLRPIKTINILYASSAGAYCESIGYKITGFALRIRGEDVT